MAMQYKTSLGVWRRGLTFVLLGAASLFMASCGGNGDSQKNEPTPITNEQATHLAAVQFDNFDIGGAVFEVATTFSSTNDTLYMKGRVDWKRHQGWAQVKAEGTEAGITEVFWNDQVVLERRPALDSTFVQMGLVKAKYVARPPAPAQRQIDRVLAIVFGLASEERDNPLLIQQTDGSSFIREDTLRGEQVEVLRYGMRNQYWLNTENKELMRFEGNSASGTAPIVVDIISRAPQNIPSPLSVEVVRADQISDIGTATS
jgi:hypothetical protein